LSIYAFEDFEPVVAPDAYVHPEAVVIGDVQIGSKCFIGAGAVLRADFGKIIIGDGSNVQENCVLHVTPGLEVRLEENVVIAHGAKLHDAHVKRDAVVGMNAILLHRVVVEEEAMVAAGAVLPIGFVVPAKKIVVGNPPRILGEMPEMYVQLRGVGLEMYQQLPERYRKGLRKMSD